ncbi:energy transducer TonB family protein [Denitromonas ohlonensis]|uniref:Energy transducer TonB n=2 Tax=Denitromonas TaxID=139331 RepID=A0A557SMJ0_9RHOO|nr:energy transducer TonB [Denitromonas ohlonensis]TVO60471.1 energy transducer TonB [Denitromonas ohlonensis]TVO78636.1 energy transducer TonB [Denitromonas ohlonensis]
MSGLAEDELFEAPWRRHARQLGLAVVVAALIGGAVLLVQGLGGDAQRPARQVTKITILPDTPPPPPPPPPKEQPRPEPKDVPKQAKLDAPKPVDTPKPQDAEQIKMEGEAGDGPSPFASGEVSQDYIGGDIGGGNNAMQYAFYSRMLQRHLQQALARRSEIKRMDYRVKLRVWLAGDGSIRRAELIDSTGSAEMDTKLRTALTDLPPVSESPPEKLPQPISVRITNRVTG